MLAPTFAARMEKDWCDQWFGSPYYAMLYGHRDDAEARDQVEALLQLTGLGAGATMLDMACGRGRHVKWFAEHGLHVSGIDTSRASIEAARASVPAADLRVHDMREVYAHGVFDLVVNLFTSFGYFEQRQDDLRVLRAVHAALKPGGSLIIDFMNTPKVIAGLVPHEERNVGEVLFKIHRRVHNGMVEKSIRVTDGAAKHQYMERVMALTPEEIVSMAVECGFTVVLRAGDFGGSPFEVESSDRFVLWAKRAGA